VPHRCVRARPTGRRPLRSGRPASLPRRSEWNLPPHRAESATTGGTMQARASAVAVMILAVLAGCQAASNPAQPTDSPRAASGSTVPGQYIVVFHDNVVDPAALARQLVTTAGGSLPLSGTYTYTSSGAGVHAYIIDTGIWTLHPEFGGRADNVFDAYHAMGEDCNGHGTHVAGTIGAATYGVAKSVSLHGVRVLSCAGLGLTSDVIAGVDWVTANHVSPAVANMSLGGGKSSALDQAVTNLYNSGVFLAVAAGNDDVDACTESPSGAPSVFTVAASEKTDAKASYSNWGTCVEVYAPGSSIKSTFLAGTTMTLSGTSMATPHVV